MRRLLLCLTLLLLPAAAGAAPSAVYAFGDSLSDRKNLFQILGIPQPPYADGRFSNGPTWVEQLATSLGVGPLQASNLGGTDFAVGGAMTGTIQPIDLQGQVGIYATSGFFPPAPPGALFTIWAGENEVLTAADVNPALAVPAAQAAAANVVTAAETLVTKGGAREMLILGLPDLGDTPRLRGTPLEATATTASKAFNTSLATLLAASTTLADLPIATLDVMALLDDAIAHPAAYGFTNVTDACVTGSYASPGTACAPDLAGQNKYLFWDSIHPTTAAHAIIAAAALAAIPEPAALLVFGLGLGGLVLLRRPGRPAHSSAMLVP